MRILAFELSPSTLLGGSERSYFDVLTGLSSRGHEVILFHTADGNLVGKYQLAGVETIKLDMSYLIRPGHRLRDINSMFTAMRTVRKKKSPGCTIYLNFAEALPFAATLKLLFGFRIVCHLR